MEPARSSTAEILYDVFQAIPVEVSREVASLERRYRPEMDRA